MSIETPRPNERTEISTPSVEEVREAVHPDLKKSWIGEHVDTRAKKMLALGAIGGVVIGGGAAGLAAMNHYASTTQNETLAPNPNESILPSVEATAPGELQPTPSPSDISIIETQPTIIEKYTVAELESMSAEDFSKLPNIDKGPYLKSLLSHTDERSSFFGGVDGRLYKFNPLDIASEDNTASEIIRQLSFEAQLAFAQTLNPDTVGDWTLDTAAAKKALSAHFYNTTGEDVLPLYKTKLDVINVGSTAHTYKTEQTEAEFVDGPASVNDTYGNPMKSATLQFDDNGTIHTMQVVYDKLDSETSIWKVYSDTTAK